MKNAKLRNIFGIYLANIIKVFALFCFAIVLSVFGYLDFQSKCRQGSFCRFSIVCVSAAVFVVIVVVAVAVHIVVGIKH